jgi:quinol monooxygenase YgiN
MIVLVAQYQAQPGRGDEVEAAVKRMASLVKQHEPGCLLYQANRSREDPDHFLLYEQYADEAALEAHRQAPHFKEIVEGTIVPMLDKRERAFYNLVAS